MRRENLWLLGELLYGPRFQRALAEALTKAGPRTVHETHLSAWLKGARPIPEWLGPQAKALMPGGINDLLDRAKILTRAAFTSDFYDTDGDRFIEDPDEYAKLHPGWPYPKPPKLD